MAGHIVTELIRSREGARWTRADPTPRPDLRRLYTSTVRERRRGLSDVSSHRLWDVDRDWRPSVRLRREPATTALRRYAAAHACLSRPLRSDFIAAFSTQSVRRPTFLAAHFFREQSCPLSLDRHSQKFAARRDRPMQPIYATFPDVIHKETRDKISHCI